ncbi:Transcriptional regulator [Paramixta manurensis]|uniref:Transcriptional regulator n=1 Tax=Paramixta manurensis TaxID=2740817 RepID=A0A6M8U918_9GAMM|nr:Transcriptional regulator [Erwiniaceae bacterium PD-1]
MLSAIQRELLQLISASEGLSRTELALRTGLSKAAMSAIVRDMLGAGLIIESDTMAGSGQGRPSVKLVMRAEAAYFVGISLNASAVRMVLINLWGEIICRHDFPLVNNPEILVEHIQQALPKLFQDGKITADQVLGIGVTLSGFIDENQATCVQSTLLGWRQVPLAKLLYQAIGIDVFIENDAKALAVSEKLYGHARSLNNFILVTHGDGIGSASFIHGQLYRGAHGGAGEIAHCTIEPGGTPCRCGKRGCLDTIASLIAIQEQAKAEQLAVEDLSQLETLAMNGSAQAIALLHRAGNALGLAMANLIQLQDPETLLLAHQPATFDGLLNTVVRQSLEAHVLPAFAGKTPLIRFTIEPDTWAHAAASVAAHRFLTPR